MIEDIPIQWLSLAILITGIIQVCLMIAQLKRKSKFNLKNYEA